MITRRPPTPARTDPRLDQLLDSAILAGLTVLILVGFAASYRTLRDLAATVGGYPQWLAPAVPLSFDLGIVVLSLKVARGAREGRTAPLLRLLVGVLSAATVAANASAAATWAAGILHAVPPAMFVICFESVIVSARRRSLAAMGLMPEPLPRLRAAQWLLAPRETWTCWRGQILAGIGGQELRQHPARPGASSAPAPTPAEPSTSTVTFPVTTSPSRERVSVVRELLRDEPQASTARIVEALNSQGHTVSLRTAQRLRAQAMRGEPAAVELATLKAVHG